MSTSSIQVPHVCDGDGKCRGKVTGVAPGEAFFA